MFGQILIIKSRAMIFQILVNLLYVTLSSGSTVLISVMSLTTVELSNETVQSHISRIFHVS